MPNYVCFTRRDWPVKDQAEWDSAAARQRLFDHFGWQNERSSKDGGGDTKTAFLLTDADRLGEQGSYRAPIADVIDGTVTVTRGALRSASTTLGATKDLVERERKRARETLDHYYARLNQTEDGEERSLLVATMPIGKGRIVKPERVIEEVEGERREGGMAMPELPEKLLAQVHDRDALAETPLYLFPAASSSNLPDTYGTRMLRSSLNNFAASAQRGLPLVNSHRKDMLPIGRIYDGSVHTRDGITRAEFHQYMAMGDYDVAGVRTASVVQGIRLGINRDTSVGFYGGRVLCSICKRDMPMSFFDLLFGDEESMCFEHMPLVEYDELDDKGKPTGQRVMCYGDVDGANCGEMSLVFKGATPEAQVISGKRTQLTFEEVHSPVLQRAFVLDQAGRLERAAAAALDDRFNLSGRGCRFDALLVRFAGARGAEPTHEESDVTDEERAKGKKKNDPNAPPSDSNPDPDGDGDDDRTPDGDSDNSHWTTDGKKKKGKWNSNAADTETPGDETEGEGEEEGRAASTSTHTDPPAGGSRSAPSTATSGASAGGADFVGQLRALMIDIGAVDKGYTGDPVAHLRSFYKRELPGLRERADLGEQAMTALREEVQAEGVRAFGKDKMPEFYNGIIEHADMPTLRSLKEHWRQMAAERGLVGGRATTEAADGENHRTVDEDEIPDYAFRAR